jgi:uncharacterized repeat protein (TIGR02543 family)
MRKRPENGIYPSFFILLLLFSACENDIINIGENDVPIVQGGDILGIWRSLTPVEKTPEEQDFLFIHIDENTFRMTFHDKNGFYDAETLLIPYTIDAGAIKYVLPDNAGEGLLLWLEARGEQRILRLTEPVPIYFERISDPSNPVPVVYRVFYDANNADDGSAPVDETEYTSGASVTLAGQMDLFKTGYLFDGWTTKADGKTEYNPGDELILEDQGITLYAVWIERPKDTPTYTIVYEGNGHTSAPETVPVDTNAYAQGDRPQISLPGELVKTGYDFAGWNTLRDGTGTAFFPQDIIEMENKNITLYAIWTSFRFNTFTVDGRSSLSITGYIGIDTEIVIPEEINTLPVTAIDKIVFDNTRPGSEDKRLTEIIIPPSIITIGDSAFADNQLSEIILPEGLTSIGNYAFYNNQLTEIRIPDKVETIGEKAFYANELSALDLGKAVRSLGEQAFAQNQLTSVSLPPGITSLGRATFYGNNILSIILGADLDIAPGALGLGDRDAPFRECYTANGKQAGVYEYSPDEGWKKAN